MTKYISTLTYDVAKAQDYDIGEFQAGKEYYMRKERMTNPPGEFDSKKRFTASERTAAVCNVRAPSAAYPFSEMHAARSSGHVAELFEVEPLAVKRIAKALDLENALSATCSQHEFLVAKEAIRKVLKPMKRESVRGAEPLAA